jgi:ribosome-interacting GTPase 1
MLVAMPANLTPEYEKAEVRYRRATTDKERVAALEEMLSAIPKHKGTEKMQADIKRRLSHLRKAEQKSSHAKGPDPFHVPHSGAGQVVIIGPPNTGKSSLLAATTHAEAKVADFPFTTTVPLPGMWEMDDVQIELVDTPPLTPEHVPPGLWGTIRNADVVGVMVEAGEMALDQVEMMLGILKARGLTLCSVPRNLISAANEHRQSGLIIANKIDAADPETIQALTSLYDNSVKGGERLAIVPISTRLRQGLDGLFTRLWELLAMVRIYAKEPGKPPDLSKPFVIPLGSTVADLALQIHRDLPERMKFARLWGHSRFAGQQVHKTEVLQDRDVVEMHE